MPAGMSRAARTICMSPMKERRQLPTQEWLIRAAVSQMPALVKRGLSRVEALSLPLQTWLLQKSRLVLGHPKELSERIFSTKKLGNATVSKPTQSS